MTTAHESRPGDDASRGNRNSESSDRAVAKQEKSMSKLIKIAVVLAVGAVAIAAKQYAAPAPDKAALSVTAASVSPSDLMRGATQLPELKIENLF
jgi:hypothetical protein